MYVSKFNRKILKIVAPLTLFLLVFSCACAYICIDTLFLSKNDGDTQRIEVPDFVGQNIDDILSSENNYFSISAEYRNDALPEGTVISQKPEGGSFRKVTDKRTCNLLLTVSLGEEKNEMPQLVGKNIRDAEAILRKNSIKYEIIYRYNKLAPYGQVTAQSHGEGEYIEKSTVISITVSLGES